jgi:hypothetical protein
VPEEVSRGTLMLKHVSIYFVVAFGLELAMLLSGNGFLAMILLFQVWWCLFSFHVAPTRVTYLYVIGLIVDAAILASAALLVEDAVRRRKIIEGRSKP